MKPDSLNNVAEDVKRILGISRKPLKHHMLGLEAEFMLLDEKGMVAHKADYVLRKAKDAKQECAKSMLELNSFPSKTVTDTMQDMLEKTKSLLDAAEKMGYSLYFYGTYPGKFTPLMRKKDSYSVKEKIFGKEKFKIAGRCIAFHCHYTLPRGMFDYFGKSLKLFIKSRISKSLVGSYNMLIAMDPALTTFAQSSPYYQGKFYGKDARTMLYRGSRIFGVNGLYTGYQDFGGLPPYMHTLFDIMDHVEDRFSDWSLHMKRLEINARALTLYGSSLDTNWSPVKINPLGTLEMRGTDMNRLALLTPLALIMRSVLNHIHEKYVNVADSDIAIKEPFKIEGDTIYIPPYTYVYNVLQRDSALYGMESPFIRLYCTKFLDMAEKISPQDKGRVLKPLRKMLAKKKTVSDEIIWRAKKMGYRESIPPGAAAELSLKISDKIYKDIDRTEKLVSFLETNNR